MKVLMVSKACVVGAYQRKLEELAARGVDLMVVVPPYWQEESRRIPLERLHTNGYELVVEPVRFNGRFHLFHFPSLGRRVREFRPDVVHADEEPYNPATWHMLYLAGQVGAKSVFFTWQNLYRSYMPPFSWIEQYCFASTSQAIAGNAEAVGVLRRKGFGKPVHVIPQFGVDPHIFRPSEQRTASSEQRASAEREARSECSGLHLPLGELPGPPLSQGEGRGEGRPQDSVVHSSHFTFHPSLSSVPSPQSSTFRIGYVGRLVEQKGLMDLLDAAALLGSGFQLMLVGAGPLRPELEAKAAELGIADKVEIRGGVPSGQMPEVYNSLDALVLPSRTRANWKEQFGRALTEAMACEVPVVGSDSGEIPNVIGNTGLVFPEGDVPALAKHLASLRDSVALRCELGSKGRQRVMERFTQASIAEQTYGVYRQMLESA